MKQSLIFVSHNKNKLLEIKNLIPDDFNIRNLNEIDFHDDIKETGQSLEENALIKARHIHRLFKTDCFADDTGLEVKALKNEPGIFSARYAGDQCNSTDNMNKLLKELEPYDNRTARFRTVIALIYKNQEYLFEGIVTGKIIKDKKGSRGFGYDPIFLPDGYSETFAEMPLNEKNKISHRARALRKLVDFLSENSDITLNSLFFKKPLQ